MAQAIDQETRDLCAQLWVEDGLTYEGVAARTGVSVGALKKWSADEDWPARRREHRQGLREIREDTLRLRRSLIKKALGSLNAQDVYAVTSLETLLLKARGDAAPPEVPVTREIRTPQEAVDALQEAVERKVNQMLAGDISLAGIKDLKQSLELIDRMKTHYAPAEAEGGAENKGLSDEAADEIRRSILGIEG